ncbi:hypothetical protein HPP92_025791 [Vanilla planifolia]|uniref:Uncharacterized protein n=1 Tax=Vanilla planifolia TaxID=51239 RepID=A0A835U8E6_VANPL|nr:hypothetical protein HPP92_026085 [Vanilla planifolia]KAG0452242.1 hypothetical protein HPP92_025791 [Vanilla planifolia]
MEVVATAVVAAMEKALVETMVVRRHRMVRQYQLSAVEPSFQGHRLVITSEMQLPSAATSLLLPSLLLLQVCSSFVFIY